jgi:hypothetical protein
MCRTRRSTRGGHPNRQTGPRQWGQFTLLLHRSGLLDWHALWFPGPSPQDEIDTAPDFWAGTGQNHSALALVLGSLSVVGLRLENDRQ